MPCRARWRAEWSAPHAPIRDRVKQWKRRGRTAYADGMSGNRHARSEEERREALRTLERLRNEGDSVIGSSLARPAGRTLADDPADQAEVWGRRVGRALSVAAFIALCLYLYATYLR